MSPLSIVLDRIEGSRAVVDIGGEVLDLPAAVLPPDAQEGSVLVLVLAPDATRDAITQAEARLARLETRTGELPDDIEL